MTAGKYAQCDSARSVNLPIGRLNFRECLVAAERVVAKPVAIPDFEIQGARSHQSRQTREKIICSAGQLVKVGQERLARPVFEPSGFNQLLLVAQIPRKDTRLARSRRGFEIACDDATPRHSVTDNAEFWHFQLPIAQGPRFSAEQT